MSKNYKNPTQNLQNLLRTVAKFHYIISIGLIIIGIAFIAYNINGILNLPPDMVEGAPKIGFSDKFDAETIEKIDTFKYRNESTTPPTPDGRTNPFVE